MTYGIVFMTALVPTKGHERLVKNAAEFMHSVHGTLYVVVSSRSHEPKITRDRSKFFYVTHGITVIDHFDDMAPQNPKTDEEWEYWTSMIREYRCDYIFGSEKYGNELAMRSGAAYVPIDPDREVCPVKGTNVRREILSSHKYLIPEWVLAKKTNYVLFGQESVGKTTTCKVLATKTGTPFFHEWARPYLETVGPEVSIKKMDTIFRMQNVIDRESSGFPAMATFQDTDIVSTYGYMKFWNPGETALIKEIKSAIELKDPQKQEYLVLSPKNVPFEKDVLRYGGDERETTMDFWIEILEEFGFQYTIIEGDTFRSRFEKIWRIIEEKIDEVRDFVRD